MVPCRLDRNPQPMLQASPTNNKLIDSLAQIILSLSQEERQLLELRIQQPQTPEQFFSGLSELPLDLEQPTLEEISQIVKDVRQEIWTA
jgi:hypothetical protein